MSNKELVLNRFKIEKYNKTPLTIEFKTLESLTAKLEMITDKILSDADGVALLAKWRDENSEAFPAQFKVTLDGTKIWCQKALLDKQERILFWVIDSTNKKIGHIGLFRMNDSGDQIEIDNIVRGEKSKDKKIIQLAIEAMLNWQRTELKIGNSYLRVFSNNDRAINLYKNMNYVEIQRVPLKKKLTAESTDWIEIISSPYEVAEKYFVTMRQI